MLALILAALLWIGVHVGIAGTSLRGAIAARLALSIACHDEKSTSSPNGYATRDTAPSPITPDCPMRIVIAIRTRS